MARKNPPHKFVDATNKRIEKRIMGRCQSVDADFATVDVELSETRAALDCVDMSLRCASLYSQFAGDYKTIDDIRHLIRTVMILSEQLDEVILKTVERRNVVGYLPV